MPEFWFCCQFIILGCFWEGLSIMYFVFFSLFSIGPHCLFLLATLLSIFSCIDYLLSSVCFLDCFWCICYITIMLIIFLPRVQLLSVMSPCSVLVFFCWSGVQVPSYVSLLDFGFPGVSPLPLFIYSLSLPQLFVTSSCFLCSAYSLSVSVFCFVLPSIKVYFLLLLIWEESPFWVLGLHVTWLIHLWYTVCE